MELVTINKLYCYLFPNGEIKSHFTICYTLIKTIKNICIDQKLKLLTDICKIMKIPLYHPYIDVCNMLITKLTNFCITISPDYVLYKSFNVPLVDNDNFVIISACADSGTIEYFSILTGDRIKSIETSYNDTSKISRANNILISCPGSDNRGDHDVKLYDITSGILMQNIIFDVILPETSYMSSANNILAIASYDKTILYDIINNTVLHTFDIGLSVYLTKDVLVGLTESYIIIYDVKNYEMLWKIESEDAFTLLIYNDMLIYGGDGNDYNINIFDMKTGKIQQILKGHTLGIQSLLVHNDILISGSIDNTIKFWDITTGINIKTLYGHTERITSLAIKDNYLISGDWDSKILIWDITIDKLVRTINTIGWVNSLMLVNLKYTTIS